MCWWKLLPQDATESRNDGAMGAHSSRGPARLLASCVFLIKTTRERNLKIVFRQRTSSANTSNPSAILDIPLLPLSTAYPKPSYKINTAFSVSFFCFGSFQHAVPAKGYPQQEEAQGHG